jgi:hypothetical protein
MAASQNGFNTWKRSLCKISKINKKMTKIKDYLNLSSFIIEQSWNKIITGKQLICGVIATTFRDAAVAKSNVM